MSVKSSIYLFAPAKVHIQLYVQVYSCVLMLLYMQVYNCIYMLMPAKSCRYLFAHAKVHIQLYMRVYSCVFMLTSMKSSIYMSHCHMKMYQSIPSLTIPPGRPLGIRTFSLPWGSGFRLTFFVQGVGVSN